MDAVRVGREIREARKAVGMTQLELSQILGLTPKYISNIECGARLPQLETFVAIANTLRVDANTLLHDELVVADRIRASQLWDRLSTCPVEKREMMLRVLEVLAETL